MEVIPPQVRDGLAASVSRRLAGRFALLAAGRGRGHAQPCFEHGDALMKAVILLARLLRHVAHDIEILALDDAHIIEHTLDLRLYQRVDLTPYPLRRTGGV